MSDIYLQSFRTMFVTVQLELQLLQFMLQYLKKKMLCYNRNSKKLVFRRHSKLMESQNSYSSFVTYQVVNFNA